MTALEPIDASTKAQYFAAKGKATLAVCGKIPVTPRGASDASTDPQVVADMYFSHADADGVGVHMAKNGILVVDIDNEHHPGAPNGYASLVEAGISIPENAYRYPSQSGKGEHVVFAAPEGAVSHTPFPGVDIKAGNSYVVWSGDVPERWEFLPAPEWTLKVATSAPSPDPTSADVQRWIDGHPGAIGPDLRRALDALPAPGAVEWYEPRLRALAMPIIRAADFDTGGALAREEFIRGYAIPGTEWDTEKKRRRAARAFDRQAKSDGFVSSFASVPDVTVTFASEDGAGEAGAGEAAAPEPAPIRSLSSLMAEEFAPLDWVVPGVIPEGTTLLVAPPKIGKSWLALDIALAAATGTDALGCVPTGESRPVLYVDLESGERRLKERVRAQGWRGFGNFEYLLDPVHALTEIAAFMGKHRGARPLVVLDTIGAVMSDRASTRVQYKHDYEEGARFQRMTKSDPGSAVLLVHHTRKMQANDPMDSISGTNGYAGAVDTPIVLQRPDRHAADGTLNVMARDFEGGEFAVRLDGCRWHLVGGDAEAAKNAHERIESERVRNNLGGVSQGLLMVIESDPDRIWTIADVVARYGGTSDRDTITKTLSRLADKGQIARISRGVYASRVEAEPLAA